MPVLLGLLSRSSTDEWAPRSRPSVSSYSPGEDGCGPLSQISSLIRPQRPIFSSISIARGGYGVPGGGVAQVAQGQLLREDPNLPFLETAWSRRKMAELFNREVMPSISPGQQVLDMKKADAVYTPGRKCVVRYSLHLDGERGKESRWAIVSFAKDERLEEDYRGHYSLNGDGRAENAVYLPQSRCLVEIYPRDWRLPSLPLARQPETVAPLLGEALADASDTSSPACLKVKVLRYRPHYRCVFGYAMATSGNGPTEMVGKLYPPGH